MWRRVDRMRWQWVNEAETLVDRSSQVPSDARCDPHEKCKLWQSALIRSNQSPADCSYLDVLDEYSREHIAHLAAWAVIGDRRKMGWAAVHEEFGLLPRCPVHDTVSLPDIVAHHVQRYNYDAYIVIICGLVAAILLIGFLYIIGIMGLVE